MNEDIASTSVIVHKERYAYCQVAEKPDVDCFFISQDSDEITVVVREEKLEKVMCEKVVKWFRLIEFKIAKPFVSVGFLATVSSAIAAKGKNVLLVSTFSKDYAFVKDEDAGVCVDALKEQGFHID